MGLVKSSSGMAIRSARIRRAAARSLRAVAAAGVVATLLAGCSSTTPTPGAKGDPSTPTPTVAGSALDRWHQAYAFLAAQTKPTEIACGWFTAAGGKPSPVRRTAVFYDFSETAVWKRHALTRNDPLPSGTFELCAATVPTTVPYGPAIEDFLKPLGLVFAADPKRPAGLTPIEISYAGQSGSDPDIIYRDQPGLFGLRGALAQLGASPFEPGTSKIVQPTDEATAGLYLQYAAPLLTWYGYQG